MGDVDSNTLAEAARRYTALRRRYWRFFVGLWALGALAGAIGLAVGQKPGPFIGGVLILPLVLGFVTCWAVCLVTDIALKQFRCPRCGKRFTLTWWISWPSDRCKHCDLDLGPAEKAVAKPTAVVDRDFNDPTW